MICLVEGGVERDTTLVHKHSLRAMSRAAATALGLLYAYGVIVLGRVETTQYLYNNYIHGFSILRPRWGQPQAGAPGEGAQPAGSHEGGGVDPGNRLPVGDGEARRQGLDFTEAGRDVGHRAQGTDEEGVAR